MSLLPVVDMSGYADDVWHCTIFTEIVAEVNGESYTIVPEDDRFALFDEDGFRIDRGTVEKCKETFAQIVNEEV